MAEMTEVDEAAEARKYPGRDIATEAPKTRRAYLIIAIGLVVMVAWGFWPSYFKPLLRGRVDRPWFLHVHAAVFIGWLVLLVAQAFLISIGRVRLHRQVGKAGMVYGALVLCVGLFVSFAAPVRHVRAGELQVEFAANVVLYNLTDMLLFGGFFVAALIYRGRPELHKRLIVSATVALAAAAVGRVLPGGSLSYLLVWLSPLFASMVVDVVTKRRVHPLSVISVAIFIVSAFKVDILALSPIWPKLGRALISPFV